MPFANRSGDPGLGWLGEGLAGSLALRLEALGLRTISVSERLEAMDGRPIPPGSAVTLATSLEAARAARADRVVTGSFSLRDSGSASVEARLIDAREMRVLWQGDLFGRPAEVLRLTGTLALEAAARDPAAPASAGPALLEHVEDPPLPVHRLIVLALSAPSAAGRLQLLRRGLGVAPDSPDLLRALAQAELEAGEPLEALGHLEGVDPASFPDAWRLHLLRARALEALDRHGEASRELARSIAHRESADAHLMLAAHHFRGGHLTRARLELELAEDLDPGHPGIPPLRRRLAGDSP